MDSSQRKRRREVVFRPLSEAHYARLPSVSSLALCLSFFILLLFFLSTDRLSISSTLCHSVIYGPRWTLFSLSVKRSEDFKSKYPPAPKIEDRVLFPDHLLMLVSSKSVWTEGMECVYYKLQKNADSNDEGNLDVITRPILSEDRYNDFRSIVKCPLPPLNYSAAASLQRQGVKAAEDIAFLRSNPSVNSWDMTAYEAILDGNTVAVFVKGLNLRAGRDSDAAHFACHFGFRNWETDENFVSSTAAITAAQEVVRCSLPRILRNKPEKSEGIRVTVGHVNPRGGLPIRMPSAAKISRFEKNIKGKHDLCVCSMVWNQAALLREWITYHAWIGVERWFIYDNNSDDEIKEVIYELELKRYNISRHAWPWIKTQEAGFSHCALRAREECNWVGFMDVDEFYYFPLATRNRRGIGHEVGEMGFPGRNSLRYLVRNISSSPTVAEIRTDCHSFGPSGLSSSPPQGLTVGYTCRLLSPERHKSIVRPDALDVSLLNVVHHFRLKEGYKYLDVPQSTVVINHYKYQAWEVFRAKFFRRVATYVVDWQENQNEGSKDRAPGLGREAIEPPDWRLRFCEVWDTGLRDFVLSHLADPLTGKLPWL